MVSGVSGAHGRSVAKAAMVEKAQEPDIAIILLHLEGDLTVLGTRSRLRIAMSKIALLMVNGVSGAHGRVVPRPVVVEKQQEPENATTHLLLMVDLTAMVTPRISKNAWLKLAQVIF